MGHEIPMNWLGFPDEPEPEPVISQSAYCTFFDDTKERMVKQPYYNCNTCGMNSGNSICEKCIKVCHAGHDVSFNRDGSCFCDCCVECDCKLMPPQCATLAIPNTNQGRFQCKSCQKDNICVVCMRKCHKDHKKSFSNRGQFTCACSKGSISQVQCTVATAPKSSTSIVLSIPTYTTKSLNFFLKRHVFVPSPIFPSAEIESTQGIYNYRRPSKYLFPSETTQRPPENHEIWLQPHQQTVDIQTREKPPSFWDVMKGRHLSSPKCPEQLFQLGKPAVKIPLEIPWHRMQRSPFSALPAVFFLVYGGVKSSTVQKFLSKQDRNKYPSQARIIPFEPQKKQEQKKSYDLVLFSTTLETMLLTHISLDEKTEEDGPVWVPCLFKDLSLFVVEGGHKQEEMREIWKTESESLGYSESYLEQRMKDLADPAVIENRDFTRMSRLCIPTQLTRRQGFPIALVVDLDHQADNRGRISAKEDPPEIVSKQDIKEQLMFLSKAATTHKDLDTHVHHHQSDKLTVPIQHPFSDPTDLPIVDFISDDAEPLAVESVYFRANECWTELSSKAFSSPVPQASIFTPSKQKLAHYNTSKGKPANSPTPIEIYRGESTHLSTRHTSYSFVYPTSLLHSVSVSEDIHEVSFLPFLPPCSHLHPSPDHTSVSKPVFVPPKPVFTTPGNEANPMSILTPMSVKLTLNPRPVSPQHSPAQSPSSVGFIFDENRKRAASMNPFHSDEPDVTHTSRIPPTAGPKHGTLHSNPVSSRIVVSTDKKIGGLDQLASPHADSPSTYLATPRSNEGDTSPSLSDPTMQFTLHANQHHIVTLRFIAPDADSGLLEEVSEMAEGFHGKKEEAVNDDGVLYTLLSFSFAVLPAAALSFVQYISKAKTDSVNLTRKVIESRISDVEILRENVIGLLGNEEDDTKASKVSLETGQTPDTPPHTMIKSGSTHHLISGSTPHSSPGHSPFKNASRRSHPKPHLPNSAPPTTLRKVLNLWTEEEGRVEDEEDEIEEGVLSKLSVSRSEMLPVSEIGVERELMDGEGVGKKRQKVVVVEPKARDVGMHNQILMEQTRVGSVPMMSAGWNVSAPILSTDMSSSLLFPLPLHFHPTLFLPPSDFLSNHPPRCLITHSQIRAINSCIPGTDQMKDWELTFDKHTHGSSMTTLCSRSEKRVSTADLKKPELAKSAAGASNRTLEMGEGMDRVEMGRGGRESRNGSCVLLVEDVSGGRVIGAYLSHRLRQDSRYYGNGSTFVFRFGGKEEGKSERNEKKKEKENEERKEEEVDKRKDDVEDPEDSVGSVTEKGDTNNTDDAIGGTSPDKHPSIDPPSQHDEHTLSAPTQPVPPPSVPHPPPLDIGTGEVESQIVTPTKGRKDHHSHITALSPQQMRKDHSSEVILPIPTPPEPVETDEEDEGEKEGFEVFRSTLANSYFIRCNTTISIGGGNGIAIFLREAFETGSTSACPTFFSPPLTTAEFVVGNLQIWSLFDK
ncbi:hypothetical protein BLNAU_2042 [Blattamonas nauphoetae]|uniref:Oxidation resistance protein 1 n=1 Tax=Blattamonas nauphoetae TaxID=2049346 RepID=A0ABQ9YHF8_9EUKA|nr:hypothetical protein BLNAU_2042 [Blattamonas nauphoetae]